MIRSALVLSCLAAAACGEGLTGWECTCTDPDGAEIADLVGLICNSGPNADDTEIPQSEAEARSEQACLDAGNAACTCSCTGPVDREAVDHGGPECI